MGVSIIEPLVQILMEARNEETWFEDARRGKIRSARVWGAIEWPKLAGEMDELG